MEQLIYSHESHFHDQKVTKCNWYSSTKKLDIIQGKKVLILDLWPT